jgi:2-dehydropantoate 2-reductase
VSEQVVIVGGGAMGGAFAAAIAASGRDTVIVDVAPAVLEAIASDGLRIVTADGERSVPMRATADPATLGISDIVLIFVKAAHTAAAAATLGPLIGPETVVASLQNGWGNADVLAAHLPPSQLVVGVTYHSATVTGPGQIRHTGRGATFVGPYLDDGLLDGAERVARLLDEAGFEAHAKAEVKTEIWRKLVLNAATLPTSSLTGLTSGQLGQAGRVLETVDALAREAVLVARAQGYDIGEQERLDRIHAVLAGAGTGRSSMLQDVMARRLTEVDTVNGAVVQAGDRLGIDVPLNRAMVALVHGLERSWETA